MYLIGEKRAGSGEEWGLNIWREEGENWKRGREVAGHEDGERREDGRKGSNKVNASRAQVRGREGQNGEVATTE